MIKNNLAVLMAERGLKIADLYNATGISKTTLMAIANNTGKGIQYETIDKLCNFLNVTPDSFFDYVPYLLSFSDAISSQSGFNGVYNFLAYFKRGDQTLSANIRFHFQPLSIDFFNDANAFDFSESQNFFDMVLPSELKKGSNSGNFDNGFIGGNYENFFKYQNINRYDYDYLLSIDCHELNYFYDKFPLQFKRELINSVINECGKQLNELFRLPAAFLSDEENQTLDYVRNKNDGKYKILISLAIGSNEIERQSLKNQKAILLKKKETFSLKF